MLKKVYYLHLKGDNFIKNSIKYDEKPNDDEIEQQLIKYGTLTAQIEERYELVK